MSQISISTAATSNNMTIAMENHSKCEFPFFQLVACTRNAAATKNEIQGIDTRNQLIVNIL